jgi:hypothetical protein
MMRRWLWGAALWMTLGTVTLGIGCQDEAGRFPVCRNNRECIQKDKDTPVCENLRCVECAYDNDCREAKKGDSCNRNSYTCMKAQ